MNLLFENSLLFAVIFLFFILLITYQLIYFRRLKIKAEKKVESLYLALKSEQQIKRTLKKTNQKINLFENQTRNKFMNIKVKIFNLDFSYQEVLSKM